MSTVITEIVRRSEQGVTMPFLCRSETGSSYFVKGMGVGSEALRAEWVGAHLAQALELPVAPFDVMEIPPELVDSSAIPGVAELHGVYAFGSQAIENAEEINFTQTLSLPLELRADVLLLDWWIQNDDRRLRPLGGNPNLLTLGRRNDTQLWLIDHHSAFDRQFDPQAFWRHHVFAGVRPIWTAPWQRRALIRLNEAIAELNEAWDAMPLLWFPEGDPTSLVSELERERLTSILTRTADASDAFWQAP